MCILTSVHERMECTPSEWHLPTSSNFLSELLNVNPSFVHKSPHCLSPVGGYGRWPLLSMKANVVRCLWCVCRNKECLWCWEWNWEENTFSPQHISCRSSVFGNYLSASCTVVSLSALGSLVLCFGLSRYTVQWSSDASGHEYSAGSTVLYETISQPILSHTS